MKEISKSLKIILLILPVVMVLMLAITTMFSNISYTNTSGSITTYQAEGDDDPNVVTIQFNSKALSDSIITDIGTTNMEYWSRSEKKIKMTKENIANVKSLSFSSKIDDLTGIEKFTSLQSIWFFKCGINDISLLGKLPELGYLNLNNNCVTDLSPLENCTKLKTIYLKNNNLEDITVLGKLPNLYSVYLEENNVRDITVLENNPTVNNIHLESNSINDEVNSKEYVLPTIIANTQKNSSKIYIDADLELQNCTLSEDKQKVILNNNLNKDDVVTVKVPDGKAKDTILTLVPSEEYINPAIATIEYGVNDDKNVATISFNKENVIITNNDGKNTYTLSDNEEFTFEYVDENGNVGSKTAKIDNTSNVPPVATITYDIQEMTDKSVTATISFDKENVTITNNDGKNTYTFNSNGEFTFEFEDAAGNKGTATAKVSNIKGEENTKNEDENDNITKNEAEINQEIKSQNKNVNTSDMVITYIVLLSLAIVLIGTTILYNRKKVNIFNSHQFFIL